MLSHPVSIFGTITESGRLPSPIPSLLSLGFKDKGPHRQAIK